MRFANALAEVAPIAIEAILCGDEPLLRDIADQLGYDFEVVQKVVGPMKGHGLRLLTYRDITVPPFRYRGGTYRVGHRLITSRHVVGHRRIRRVAENAIALAGALRPGAETWLCKRMKLSRRQLAARIAKLPVAESWMLESASV
jgi:hypothetical protein